MADLKDLLPDDLKANPSLSKFNDPAALAKSYLELESFRGTAIRIPGPDAGEADRKEFQEKLLKAGNGRLVDLPEGDDKVVESLRALGRIPKEAKDYDLSGVTFEVGTELSPQEQDDFRKTAHALGLTKAAAKAELERLAKQRSDGVAALKANEAELRKEWGQAYDDKMRGYRVLAEQIGAPQTMKDAIAKGRITKDEAAWLDRLGSQLGRETRNLATLETPPAPKITAEEAKARLSEALKKGNDWNLPASERQAALKAAMEYQAILTPPA